ncbi:hypothetical protein NQ315_014868 [Exocentrus adspersus]|uniref:Integrase zinc-binding domain-containing protein n=1 Tax=Exocentrus adspersus TaxID=1586481 RepID=A0AAV8VLN1_9CUCU|nr:hypothetical protein NQ315_014868 [Exocentrus adspersus]
MFLVKHVQNSYFSKDITQILNEKLPSKGLRKLNAFLDEKGILRVGGRLRNCSPSFDAKFSILLPRTSPLTDLIIRDFHNSFLHPGVQTLQFLIVQQFWILSMRRAIKSCVSNCIGKLVLIKYDALPSFNPSLGRIIAFHPGRDSASRVALS